MSLDPELIDARNAVEAKRAQLMHSAKFALGEAKRRLAPDLLAEQAWDKVKRKSNDLAHEAVLEAKAKPFFYGGIAAAIGLFLARKPLGKMAVSACRSARGEAAPEAEGGSSMVAAKPPPRRTRRAPPAAKAAPGVAEFHETTKPVEEKTKPGSKPAKGTRAKKKTEDV
ncbi:hypothetical protein [Sphingomicrobium astaxanthinifaciens]|uniref:hypothetical protein n=1 Tax=Sphingomicrobium astaxanthinifaciens TaxID=1227949 RepID=UPI001FCCB316|nr:hypothetical protein [Sphingomicrobium astaxanthinifaciens]MCJ7422331.1 hypothetical protein [Sphingomicrobium astaxanthinifaciens]